MGEFRPGAEASQPGSRKRTSLDPADWGSFREQAHRMLDDMLGCMENLGEQPVWQPIPEAARAHFRSGLPAAPSTLDSVHDEFLSSIVPYTARNAHPGFLGWAQGGGTAVGMMAEMLAAGLNANLGGRDQIPLDIERQVVEWMRVLFGFPEGASGLFVTGTSMANFLAVVLARNAALGSGVRQQGLSDQTPRLTAYACTSVHGSIARALDFAGVGSEALRLVAADKRGRMDVQALKQSIAKDRAAGSLPFLVVGTAGTVDTGSIDNLAAIADACAEAKLWFHVDGAYGALAMLAPELAPRLRGIERADSLAFDFHKWGQVPYDAGFLLVRDGAQHQAAFSTSSAYLAREQRGMAAGATWPCDLGLDLSRGFRALKTWMTLKVYGTEALGAVIQRTCELAQVLERLIDANDELELMAPVEMNVVCFRYRFERDDPSLTNEAGDQLNRELVIRLQESGKVAPSTTVLNGRAVIRAAIVNHRTEQSHIETLVQAALAAGHEILNEKMREKNAASWQPWVECDTRVQQLDTKLNEGASLPKEEEVALRFERASLLARTGRSMEARSDYLKVLELDSSHQSTLVDLGRLLIASGQRRAAQVVYTEAVRLYPNDLVCRVNLAGVLLEENDPQGAREHYEAALRIAPGFPHAHCGMYYALTRLGEPQEAEMHRRKGFGQMFITPKTYCGDTPPVTVLLLVSSTGGITPVEKLLDDRVFQTYVVVADFYDAKVPLPEHQLIFNAIGDVDASEAALVAAQRLLAHTSAPVINLPGAVLASSRCENSKRMAGLAGVKTAMTEMLPFTLLDSTDGAAELTRRGFRFPLLLRAPAFHMGQHFVCVQSAEELPEAMLQFPREARTAGKLLAIEYLDARGADGLARKYRVMMIDGQLYPLHLAISPNWKIHYFSADMADKPEHRAEEAEFLADMPRVLGTKAMQALRAIQQELGLEYAGIDFGLNAEGELLLFEANATMVVEHPGPDARWGYRRAAVDAIHVAVRRMLLRCAAAGRQTANR